MLKTCLAILFFGIFFHSVLAQDPLLNILSKELTREYEILKNQEIPVYFMSYRLTESEVIEVSGSHGCHDQTNRKKRRYLTIMVRVGSPEFDNFHPIKEERSFPKILVNKSVEIPFGSDEAAIRLILWLNTNEAYTEAIDKYGKTKERSLAGKIPERIVPDFSIEKPSVFYEPPVNFPSGKSIEESLTSKVISFSSPFYNNINIKNSLVKYTVYHARNYYVSSEGSKIAENSQRVYLAINATIGTTEGIELPLTKNYFAFTLKDLPSDDKIEADIKAMFMKLFDIRNASVADSYSGPALLSGNVASLFFHDILGSRIEASKLKSEDDSQTLKEKIGTRILSDGISFVSDPTLKEFRGFSLCGFYKYDDEGIKSRRVTVIDKGKLINYLCSRTPLDVFLNSNGHGRASPGFQPASRLSNLILLSEKQVTETDIKKQFTGELKKQNLPFGYYIKEAIPGLNLSGRLNPNAFTIIPTELYRIYADGTPDELVRGISMVGTPLSVFSEIALAGGGYGIYSTISNGESGNVPVSSVSPMVLINKIELQKSNSGTVRNPAR